MQGFISILNYIHIILIDRLAEVVPFFLVFSFWSVVNGQLHGFSFSTQNQKRLLKILCWWNLALPWANQCIFLMEIFFLSHVNETTYIFAICLSSKLFHHRLRFIYLFYFLKSWAENGSVFLSIIVLLRHDTPHDILSQKCISWERGLAKLPQPWGASLIWLIAF